MLDKFNRFILNANGYTFIAAWIVLFLLNISSPLAMAVVYLTAIGITLVIALAVSLGELRERRRLLLIDLQYRLQRLWDQKHSLESCRRLAQGRSMPDDDPTIYRHGL